ncbi:hypothetical protein BDN72DRAFT_858091 [Pluteus cervinus]|uniref:Uncharacterized protein n=1 Tax=Pluteus cervinus TaxID=181527 RepID=A0ACD3AT24_9AGAR|nr:hypothetical protein BDN72DRAFT_858091 [Pluteus cervinus]
MTCHAELGRAAFTQLDIFPAPLPRRNDLALLMFFPAGFTIALIGIICISTVLSSVSFMRGSHGFSLPWFRVNYDHREHNLTVTGAKKWTAIYVKVIEAVQKRMGTIKSGCANLLQFHGLDYPDKHYLVAPQHLADLESEGVISAIGYAALVLSEQVQFYIISTCPLHGMPDVCEKQNLKLLVCSTLIFVIGHAGTGSVSRQSHAFAEKVILVCSASVGWGVGKTRALLGAAVFTPCIKCLDMTTKAWGTWALFQQLLSVIGVIGGRHGEKSIANVATRWVLEQHFVGAVIIDDFGTSEWEVSYYFYWIVMWSTGGLIFDGVRKDLEHWAWMPRVDDEWVLELGSNCRWQRDIEGTLSVLVLGFEVCNGLSLQLYIHVIILFLSYQSVVHNQSIRDREYLILNAQ